MSTVTQYDLGDDAPLTPVERPRPLNSLIASARRLTKKEIKRIGGAKAEEWQDDAWDMHDLVGEQRFLAHTLAGRLSQARFFAGKLPTDRTEDIEVLEDGPAHVVVDSLTGHGAGFAQIVARAGVNLFISGDCYLLGTPEEEEPMGDGPLDPDNRITPIGTPGELPEDVDIDSLHWRLLSVSEIGFDQDGNVTVKTGNGRGAEEVYDADTVMLVRLWRPHPRFNWQADSPTRSSLPVLRELVGLTMHISAQVDSRLAGAGVFLIPESADRAIRAQAGEAGEAEESPFASSLMEAMITPISDRSSASAVVPVMPVVPDESVENFRFISFAGSLDSEARSLRDESIRRLALGQDCPPELLLGVGSMNHWGAWLVREDVVTTHLEPPLALLCDALTTQLLWPVLIQQGMTREEARDYVIWYDVDHMIMRPDRSKDAKDLFDKGAISDMALRDATGFDESDAPETIETDRAVILALDLVKQAPSLMAVPGLSVIAEQIRALLDGKPVQAAEEVEGTSTDEEPVQEPEAEENGVGADAEGPPDSDGEDGNGSPPEIVAAGLLPDDLPDLLDLPHMGARRPAPTSLMIRSSQTGE